MTLIAAVILVVAATILFTLLIRAEDIPQPEPVSPTQHLEERKARIYENLRDLQFEFRVGKLSDSDYQRTKLALQQELAGVLAEIDRIGAEKASLPATGKGIANGKGIATKTKAAPQAQVATAAAAKSEPAHVNQSPAAAEEAQGFTCPHCGAKFPVAMKFCGECGKAMA
jgi:hypothetical protein